MAMVPPLSARAALSLGLVLGLAACAPERTGSLMRCGSYDFHAVEVDWDHHAAFERCGSGVGTWGFAWMDQPEPVYSVTFLPRIRFGFEDIDVSLGLVLDPALAVGDTVGPGTSSACVTRLSTWESDCADLTFGEVTLLDRLDDHDPDYIYLKLRWDLEFGEVRDDDRTWIRAKGKDWVGLLISD
ncbi:MAG: hypothetical protein ABIO70_01215 [Pseudomonadota bacterium]